MKIITSLLIFLIALSVWAQNDIDKFKHIVDTTNIDAIKLQYLDSIVSHIDANKQPNAFVNYSKRYIALAETLQLYEKMADKTVRVFYYINNVQNDKEDALATINRVFSYQEQIKDSFLLGSMYLKRGGAYYDVDFGKAVYNYSKAIENFGQNDSVYVADSYLFRAQAESYQGKFLEAINDYKTASTYYEALGDANYVVHAKSGIAVIYGMNKFYDQAEKIEDEILEYALEHDLANAAVSTLYNKSIHAKEKDSSKLQEKLLLEALNINKEKNNNDVYSAIFIETALVRLYSHIGKPEEAYTYFKSMDARLNEFKNEKQLMNHYNKAKVAILKSAHRYNDAIVLLNEVIAFTKEGKNYDDLVDLKKELAELYNLVGNTRASYTSFQEYNFLKDSLFSVQKTNALTYYQTLYETEKKEKEIIEKKASIVSLEKDNNAKKRLLGFSVAGLTLLFFCIVLYRNKQHHKKSKQQQEEFSRQLLVSQEQERERISKDLHDSVGQSLLLIKNKIVLNADENTKNMFNNTIEEVRSISRALHPFQLEKFGIGKAIENTINEADESTDIFFSSHVDDISNLLSKEKEIHLYRIIQETLSNIIKHSQTEAAKISVVKKEKNIVVTIQDHGKGFDFSEKYNDFNSLGLKTIRERIKYISGTMKVDSEKDKGTTFTYIIPIA